MDRRNKLPCRRGSILQWREAALSATVRASPTGPSSKSRCSCGLRTTVLFLALALAMVARVASPLAVTRNDTKYVLPFDIPDHVETDTVLEPLPCPTHPLPSSLPPNKIPVPIAIADCNCLGSTPFSLFTCACFKLQ